MAIEVGVDEPVQRAVARIGVKRPTKAPIGSKAVAISAWPKVGVDVGVQRKGRGAAGQRLIIRQDQRADKRGRQRRSRRSP